ncbi:MAG: ferritin-like domain-containing protein [Saccharofermentanales bacterium]
MDLNILDFAISMENDGAAYYGEQAELNKGNSLNPVCLMLQTDELNHAKILTNFMNSLSYELKDSITITKAKSLFSGVGNLKIEEIGVLSQLDFYTISSDKEKASIDLYTGMLAKAANDQEKELFTYLMNQEKKHFEIIDGLVSLLRMAHEWVESAEFGIRKEY